MVLYEIYSEDDGNGITFVHMLYIKRTLNRLNVNKKLSYLKCVQNIYVHLINKHEQCEFGIFIKSTTSRKKKCIFGRLLDILFNLCISYIFLTLCVKWLKSQASSRNYEDIIRGGFRGGVRGVRPPKILKAYVIQR